SGSETLQSATTVNGVNTLIAGSGSDVLAAFAGDTLVFDPGFGTAEVSISAGGSGVPTVEFGSGISGGDLTVAAALDSSGNAALTITDGTGVVTLDGALSGQTYQFSFNGGGALTLAQF